MSLLTAFPYIAKPDAKILILGSMPGQKSLDENQYYAHPRNAFWKIMATIYNFDKDLPYQQRLEELKNNKVALWDVMQHCERPGSLDSAIVAESIIPNDFNNFFLTYKKIHSVFFNGRKAENTFKRKILPTLNIKLELITLPSTSPAYASLRFDKKLTKWAKNLAHKL